MKNNAILVRCFREVKNGGPNERLIGEMISKLYFAESDSLLESVKKSYPRDWGYEVEAVACVIDEDKRPCSKSDIKRFVEVISGESAGQYLLLSSFEEEEKEIEESIRSCK